MGLPSVTPRDRYQNEPLFPSSLPLSLIASVYYDNSSNPSCGGKCTMTLQKEREFIRRTSVRELLHTGRVF